MARPGPNDSGRTVASARRMITASVIASSASSSLPIPNRTDWLLSDAARAGANASGAAAAAAWSAKVSDQARRPMCGQTGEGQAGERQGVDEATKDGVSGGVGGVMKDREHGSGVRSFRDHLQGNRGDAAKIVSQGVPDLRTQLGRLQVGESGIAHGAGEDGQYSVWWRAASVAASNAPSSPGTAGSVPAITYSPSRSGCRLPHR